MARPAPVQRPAHAAPKGPVARSHRAMIAALAAFWIVSDVGYYFGLPLLGVEPGYNAAPVAVSLYYLYWVGLALIVFWPVYAVWNVHAPWPTLSNRFAGAAIWTAMVTAAVGFAIWVVPVIPPAAWPETAGPPPDLVIATASYFLPKSIEILFQQALMLALVLMMAADGIPLRRISLWCGVLFGTMHVLLILGGLPLAGVVRFTIMAALAGAVFPMLILRVPYGLALSIGLHWGYYAVTLLQLRLIGPTGVLPG